MKLIATTTFTFLLFDTAHALLGASLMDPTPVYVKVHCDGTDLGSASIPLGEYAGKLLEDTFAMIHPSSEHDDSNLTGLVFHGHGLGLEDYEVEDVQDEQVARMHKTTAVYSGHWNCRYCPDDSSGIMKKAWETSFASELSNTGIAYFEKTKSCTVNIDFAPPNPVESNAEIEIKCKGVHLEHATVAEATYAAHALEASYNKVHIHHEGDEKTMRHVAFDNKKTLQGHEERSKRLGLWYWQWWAKLMASIMSGDPGFSKPYDDDLPGYCWGEDDDDVTGWKLTGIGTQKWEAQFAEYLRQSEFEVFHKVQSCSIAVKPSRELLSMLREDGCPKRLAAAEETTPTEEA